MSKEKQQKKKGHYPSKNGKMTYKFLAENSPRHCLYKSSPGNTTFQKSI